MTQPGRRIDFARIASAALANAVPILERWLPDGRQEGPEWVAKNPRRADHKRGSFKVNTRTGRWSDFALTDVSGGDLISLGAYLSGVNQAEAATRLADMLGVDLYG